jgi:hypothetical protein
VLRNIVVSASLIFPQLPQHRRIVLLHEDPALRVQTS